MLVLTRKLNESIIIGSGIEVKIARINGNQVRIGITAPKNIPVYRKEIAPLFGQAEKVNKKPTPQNLVTSFNR
ncbi:MAG: carbon storage regulator [Planctomycetes bacterium GWF2_41_51]|nr:MAG: carbon storage regulator [Planctomycetes bacterium GWF2_41_51]HBG27192.1 carbon storage regulator [Phycisphaerales bacterium]